MNKQQLIDSYKQDFLMKTGEYIDVLILRSTDTWRCYGRLTIIPPIKKLVRMILDAQEWEMEYTFAKLRTTERVYRRNVVDLILYANEFTLMEIARETGRSEHTTVIHSLERGKLLAETNPVFRSTLRGITEYIEANHMYYTNDKKLEGTISSNVPAAVGVDAEAFSSVDG